MSLFRTSKFRGIASTLSRLCEGWTRRENPSVLRNRHLALDPLEQRQMLSVTVIDVDDQLVNETTSGTTTTTAGQSIAVDNDGDFVVVWEREDIVYDSDGNAVVGLDGSYQTDSNIYARYYTNEVQRLTLPQEVLTDDISGSYASMTLTYGGNEVQLLSVSGGTAPYSSYEETVVGQIFMGFDLNDDGTIGSDEDFTFVYNGYNDQDEIAASLQTAIQGLGAAPLTDVTVESLNSGEFEIHFGDSSGGENVPEIEVLGASWTSGYLPAALMSTVSEPTQIVIKGISPDDPDATARAIEKAFLKTARISAIGPIDFPWPDLVPNNTSLGPYYAAELLLNAVPEVQVTPVLGDGLTGVVFDITFGESTTDSSDAYASTGSMEDHPELVVSAIVDEAGNSLLGSSELSVVTVKQSSSEFRVNADEPDDPLTGDPVRYNQTDPQVAMDADGDFVIAWTSEVDTAGSDTDIFARCFSPMGWLEDTTDLPDDVVTLGVRALGDEFRVNTTTTNAQNDASVAMDFDGNFVVTWAGEGQDVSYFNSIYAQRFNRDGERVGSEWVVNTNNTNIQFDPYVSCSDDGHFAVTWTATSDAGYPYSTTATTVRAELYDASGNVTAGEFGVGGGGNSTSAWDETNNVLIGRDRGADTDNIGSTSTGVYAVMYDTAGAVVMTEFRANSASLDASSNAFWPLTQMGNQVAIDADGDIVVSYDGFGPDVSEDVYISDYSSTEYQNVLSLYFESVFEGHDDLLVYFNWENGLPLLIEDATWGFLTTYLGNNGDVDGTIEEVLIYAANQGATDEQMGRLRALLEEVCGLLRGEANGALFTRIDASTSGYSVIVSDSVANATRDGSNQRDMVVLDGSLDWDSFTMRLYHPYLSGYEDITVDIARTNGVINVYDTADNLEAELEAAVRTGVNWPEDTYEGGISVRVVTAEEIAEREGTEWELYGVNANDYVFEVTFQGEVHDTAMYLYGLDGTLSGSETQTLTIVPTSTPSTGQVTLSQGTNSAQITFNSDYPYLVASTIQGLLENWGNDDVQVTVGVDGPTMWVFNILFDGDDNVDQVMLADYVNPVTGEVSLDASLFFTTGAQGGATDGPAPTVLQYTYGDEGTEQSEVSIGMEPDGDYVMAWTQTTQSGDSEIYYRRFNESTDTAGPKITDFLLADGTRLKDGGQVNDAVDYIVVTFDEAMLSDTSTNSITNIDNWALLRDGELVSGGIVSVSFGMNLASGVQGGSNKWEAVIYLDGNGATTGVTSLLDGTYTIVAKNSLRDAEGNALNRTGANANGYSVERTFTVVNPSSSADTTVNATVAGDQNTYNAADNAASAAHTFPDAAQATASDADGDYVVVWTSDTVGAQGIWAALYDVTWTETSIGRTSTTTKVGEIQVSSDASATFASVAMDDDGDFVVTWSAYSSDTGWDVFARRFNAAGTALRQGEIGGQTIADPSTDPDETTFRVNSETDDTQKFSTVAMDADGDFVITWQSNNQTGVGQDGSGYGVYAKQYAADGYATSGTNELQVLSFLNNVRGTFRLVWSGDDTAGDTSSIITYKGDAFDILDAVKAAMAEVGAEVEVYAVGLNQIYIQFVGEDGSTDVPQILVQPVAISGDTGARITVTTSTAGDTAEFLVNTTTANDQLFPSVAIDNANQFIITWTSYGQDGDTAYESNVYGRLYGYDALGNLTAGAAFLVNQTTNDNQMWSSVAMDADGDFVITWTSYGQDGVGNGYGAGYDGEEGVFARRYDNTGTAVAGEFLVNTYADGAQQVSRVAMDADGDFVITWESFQDRSGTSGTANSYGIYAQRYVRTALLGQSALYGANGENGSEFAVNLTKAGEQRSPAVSMDDAGDYVIVWTGPSASSATSSSRDVFSRHYDKRTDDAGPTVTDVMVGEGDAATDVQISNGVTLTESPAQIIVYFSEEMSVEGGISGSTSVINPNNWTLTWDDGTGAVPLYNGVSSVTFAAVEGSDRKWQAILTLDSDSLIDGNQALETGTYVLTLSGSVEDVFENQLDGNGDGATGDAFQVTFDVVVPGIDSEVPVGDDSTGDQNTYNSNDNGADEAHDFPDAAQATASDADGDYVVVWTSDAAGEEGIWAQLYDVTYTEDSDGRITDTITSVELIQVTDDPTATFASVGMDDDGDFVVTWSAYTTSTGWDIFARRFNAEGVPLRQGESGSEVIDDPATDPEETIFQVNAHSDDDQKFSNVAMDADGDFVITWQSYGQDGSGYGVYAKRYGLAGEEIGGTNEVQLLSFLNNVRGTFRLVWGGLTSSVVTYSGNAFTILEDVQDALSEIGITAEIDAVGLADIYIQFVNGDGNTDVPMIQVQPVSLTGDEGASIQVQTRNDGVSAEFLVNETTDNDQMFPSIAMDDTGTFVITWTGYGQGGDAEDEGNIYLRQFAANDAYRASTVYAEATTVSSSDSSAYSDLLDSMVVEEFIVSADDPENHVTAPGTGYDGVCQIQVDWAMILGSAAIVTPWVGSGSLLSSGKHVLTAAHVVTDSVYNLAVDPDYVSMVFTLPTGEIVTLEASAVYVHPGWTGNLADGNDIAIIELKEVAPTSIERYDILRDDSVLMGAVFEKVGYGTYGQGDTGYQFDAGTKRDGENTYEMYGDVLGYGTDSMFLMYDFDNGEAAHDALGVYFGLNNLGLGDSRESTAAPGDSGGPNFVNGLIAGVTSFGVTFMDTTYQGVDVTQGIIDASFGELAGDTNVVYYSDWIDAIVGGIGGATGQETQINITSAGDQKWSSVAMDADGDFVVTWTAYGQETGNTTSNGIFAQRYDSTATAVGAAFQVNTTTDGNQQVSRVAMDADGDFVIVWESLQDLPVAGSGLNNIPNSYGIYSQAYVRNALVGNAAYGANGEDGTEKRVNNTTEGNQRSPAISMDDTGDYVVVWTGPSTASGTGNARDVFYRHFTMDSDDAGPRVVDVVTGESDEPTGIQVENGTTLETAPTQLVVYFSEELSLVGGSSSSSSVLNLNNWTLTLDGIAIYRGVAAVSFSAVEGDDRKWQAVLTLDGDASTVGYQALEGGTYILTLSARVQDVFGNRLDGNDDGTAGGVFQLTFDVYSDDTTPPDGTITPDEDDDDEIAPVNTLNEQDSVAIASNANGDYVVVWVNYGATNDTVVDDDDDDDDEDAATALMGNIMARLFDRYGNAKGAEFVVNSRYDASNQVLPDVAMDEYGNFVVVWSGQGGATSNRDEAGVFMRRFNFYGVAVDSAEVRVNTTTTNSQADPSVSINDAGQFVVSWTSYGQDGDRHGVYARYFDSFTATGSAEIAVNATTSGAQIHSDVAMSDAGRWAVVWEADGQDAGGTSIQARVYSGTSALTGEVTVNKSGVNDQTDPKVAMAPTGEFVVTWTSLSTTTGTDVYARRFTAAGVARDSADIAVAQTTTNNQLTPDVSMDDDGNFVVTWTSKNQEAYGTETPLFNDHGVFARQFNADGSAAGDEFRVNAIIKGNQQSSVVAVDADGDFVIAWVGPEWLTTGTDGFPATMDFDTVYHRVVRVNPVDVFSVTTSSILGPKAAADTVLSLEGTTGDDTFEFIGGADASSWTVKINGVVQTIGADILSIEFDGLGGTDTVTLRGTSIADTAELWYNEVSLQSANYSVLVSNVENVVVIGGGGADKATFHDSTGDDAFTGKENDSKMAGTNYLVRARNFATVTAVSGNGGSDVARLYDTTADDAVAGSKAEVKMTTGAGGVVAAQGYGEVHVFGDNGGSNTARLTDTSGDDTFECWPNIGKLYGDDYFIRIVNFGTMRVTASEGGTDSALMYGDRGLDTFTATPAQSKMSGETYLNVVTGFDSVQAAGKGNHADIARLYDSTGDDVFKRTDKYGVMSGDGYFLRAFLFHYTHGFATNGGTDIARLYDSAGDDTLKATPAQAEITGSSFYGRAVGFDQVHAYGSTGADVAWLYDSAGNDTFVASSTQSKLYGTDFYLRALAFDQVHGVASAGGTDAATLNDTTSNDYLQAEDDWAELSNTDLGLAYWATGFDSVTAKSSNSGDTKKVAAALDFLLTSNGWLDE